MGKLQIGVTRTLSRLTTRRLGFPNIDGNFLGSWAPIPPSPPYFHNGKGNKGLASEREIFIREGNPPSTPKWFRVDLSG
jgi:hypothetical protein